MQEFFLVCPIGLESFLQKELLTKWSLHFNNAEYKIALNKGGITLHCELEKGLLLNYILKCPSKILLRIKHQKCRDTPKLFNIIKKIKWKEYLAYPKVNFNCSATKSRLIHTQKIENTCLDGMKSYLEANKFKESTLKEHEDSPTQTIFIRLFQDELTISLDTSGDLLHKRGNGEFRGHAGIRENIASLLLWALLGDCDKIDSKLYDPMCGSGTFLKEATDQFKLSRRKFNCEYFSSKIILDKTQLKDIDNKWNLSIKGADIDQNIVNYHQSNKLNIIQADFFSKEIVDNDHEIIIMNPPYGKRIKISGSKNDYFRAIYELLTQKLRPKSFGVIIPSPYANDLKGKKIHFKQNGIAVTFIFKGLKS